MSSKKGWSLVLAVAMAAAGVWFMVARGQSQRSSSQTLPAGFELPKPIRPSSTLEAVQGTTKEYLDTAQSVVLVKCVDRRVDYGPGGNIFTFYTFETEESVKGLQKPRFALRLLGGTIGDTTITFPLDREFEVGKEYVLMLGADNAEGYPTINPLAIFAVRTEPDSGRKVVVPAGDGLPLYEKATGRQLQGTPGWCFLDDFIFSLKKAMQ